MESTLTINCDHCDWSLVAPWETLPDWENKTCPECGEVVVNKRDVILWKGADFLRNVGIIEEANTEPTSGKYEVQINTAPDKPLITLKEE